MPRKRRGPDPTTREPLDQHSVETEDAIKWMDLWKSSAKRVQGSRDRIADAEAVALGDKRLVPPKFLTRNAPAIADLVPLLPQRKTLLLNLTNTILENPPVVSRRRPPKGGATAEARAEEIETALRALLRDLFPWDASAGRAVQHSEFALVTLLAEDAWDAAPEYDDVLTEEEWKKLPKAEQAGYRKAELEDGSAEMKRPKRVYWRDSDGRGLEDDEYGRRSAPKTKQAYEDALEEFLASHPPFVIRGYSAFDCVPIPSADGRTQLAIRQLFEVEDLIARGYRWEGLQFGAGSQGRAMVPRGYNAQHWGSEGRVYLYQFYVYLDGDPCIVSLVGGQRTTWVADDDTSEPAITNLREKWGFSRLPVGYYYGLHLATDDLDHKGVPLMDPIGPSLVALEGLLGAVTITAWRNGTAKYAISPEPHVPPSAYLEAGTAGLKQIDVDPDADVVTTFGKVGHLAPLEHSGDTRWVAQQFAGALAESTPAASAFGGEGAESGREAALLHSFAMSAQTMTREGLRKAAEDAGSFLLEWACCFMKQKGINEIPIYADIEVEPQEGDEIGGQSTSKTVMVRLREDWIGKNYRCTAEYLPTPNPVLIEQEVSLAEKGYGSFEDVQKARGKTNPLNERIKAINDAYWKSERGQMELAAVDARQRGDLERAMQYEAWLAQQASPLQIGPDGQPVQFGPSAALDEMFTSQGQPQTGGTGGGPTSAQAALGGTIGGGRGAEMGDYAALMGQAVGPTPPNGRSAPGG